MAFRKLVEGDCGGSNALVNLTSHYVQDRGLKDEGFHSFPHSDPIASANSDQLVQEFLEETMGQTAQPFRMDSLLAEMWDLEGRVGPVRSPPVSQLAHHDEDVREWAQHYIDAGKHFEEKDEAGIWTAESAGHDPLAEGFDLGIGPKWAQEYLQRAQDSSVQEEQIVNDLSNSEEYVDSKADPLIKETAEAILKETADDSRFTDSKFMRFMRQIRDDGELTDSEDTPEHWSLEFSNEQAPERDWTAQFSAENSLHRLAGPASEESKHQLREDLWQNLSKQWDEMNSEDEQSRWIGEFGDFANSEYKFAQENPMRDMEDALRLGQEKLKIGDLPSAVLCFEAAASQSPDNALAWQLLGITQAENEQDPQAIAALKKCISLDPTNLTALMALSVCYTNENYQNQACRALKEWLRVNPKYSDLVPDVSNNNSVPFGIMSLLDRELHEEVKNLFLEAARQNPNETFDPDVQSGLGVLFNLSGETDMAVDCFRTAVQARPEDSRLWNRLGATLANGSRSEEAVDAYRSALQLSPGFIRARYNLGITCVHLGAHTEAAEHLLTALRQQSRGRGPQGESSVNMSDSIWNTLRLVVVSMLERSDLIAAVENRDVEKLCREFEVD
ncbi:peroxisomal targeting signal 1 [Nesidiocoris tenuis]|uniref:Peroxisomal targeting signal 1 n=1 Tax=Nesidiocoris tenuis TaxID=355587 RepID=A0ABN7AIB2_9HEMI|nr:peroxisomal targeting signal 1 [Nesidiocoris tenuis]